MDTLGTQTHQINPSLGFSATNRVKTLVSAVRACAKHKATMRVRDAIHWHVNRILEKQYVECSSVMIRKMVGGKYYRQFLEIMRDIPEIQRNEEYLSRGMLTELGMDPSLARCKAYYTPPEVGENTIVIMLSASSLSRFPGCFSLFDSGSANASEEFCKRLFFPKKSFEELLFLCGSPESAASVKETLERAREGFDPKIAGDGRTYAPYTNLTKMLRYDSHLDSEDSFGRLVGVDAHACHVAILAAKFASGSEKRELISLLNEGFWDSFRRRAVEISPEFTGLSKETVKTNFLANVLYKFRPDSLIWRAFKLLFPVTAANLSRFRDSDDWIIKRRWKTHEGSTYKSKTRIGQFRLSRYFCRIEGEIFRSAQKSLYYRDITSAPLHDSLLVPAKWAEEAHEAVKFSVKRVLGFDVPVKFEGE